MDLANFKAVDTFVVELSNPNNPDDKLMNPDGSRMTVTVYGPESKEFRREKYVSRREIVKKFAGMDETERKSKLAEIDEFEQVDTASLKFIASMIKEWNITSDGKKVPCTDKNKLKILEEHTWIREDLDFAINNRANFTKDSSKG